MKVPSFEASAELMSKSRTLIFLCEAVLFRIHSKLASFLIFFLIVIGPSCYIERMYKDYNFIQISALYLVLSIFIVIIYSNNKKLKINSYETFYQKKKN